MQLHASYVDGAEEPITAELRFLRLEGRMLPMKSFKPTESMGYQAWRRTRCSQVGARTCTCRCRRRFVIAMSASSLPSRWARPSCVSVMGLRRFMLGKDLTEPTKAVV